MSIEIQKLRYHITTPGSDSSRELQNMVYEAWKSIWKHEFGKVGRADDLNPDDFFRQDRIAAILYDDRLVGFHLYTFFNLNFSAAREHSYFDGIEDATFSELRAASVHKLMAMEYLSVLPDWRKPASGIKFGEVIIGLGQRLLSETPCEAAVGTPRTDVKVDQSGVKLGFKSYGQPLNKYDYECRVMVCKLGEVQTHPDAAHADIIQSLWLSRSDDTRQIEILNKRKDTTPNQDSIQTAA